MAFQECGKGHIYDTDRYPRCPYCQQNNVNRGTGGLNYGATAPLQSYGGGTPEYGATVPLKGKSFDYNSPPAEEFGATVPLSGKSFDFSPPPKPEPQGGKPFEFTPPPKPEPPEPPAKEEPAAEPKAPAFADPALPVGWLVCTEGDCRGKDYKIFGKGNTIGKSSRADIRLTDISNNKYAIWARIDYSAEENVCRLNPILSGNVYLNGVPVGVPIKLNDKDYIELGGIEYIFVSLCGSKFRWERQS